MSRVEERVKEQPTGLGGDIAHDWINRAEHDLQWGQVLRAFAIAMTIFAAITVGATLLVESLLNDSQSTQSTRDGLPVLIGSSAAFIAFLLAGISLRRHTSHAPLAHGAALTACALAVALVVAAVDVALGFPFEGSQSDNQYVELHLFSIFIVPVIAFPASIIGSAVVPSRDHGLNDDTRARDGDSEY